MALNEYDVKHTYTKYSRHVNESKERISADTVNKIQDDITEQQFETNKIKDRAFEERVYTIFENNLYTNAMFKDNLSNAEYINMAESTNIVWDNKRLRVALKPGKTTGEMKSTVIHSVHGLTIELNDFLLISNEETPVGTKIEYWIETYTGDRWPISQNTLKLPMHLTYNLENGFKVVAQLTANGVGESPAINGYAVLYFDTQVEADYGITNPDLQRFPLNRNRL